MVCARSVHYVAVWCIAISVGTLLPKFPLSIQSDRQNNDAEVGRVVTPKIVVGNSALGVGTRKHKLVLGKGEFVKNGGIGEQFNGYHLAGTYHSNGNRVYLSTFVN